MLRLLLLLLVLSTTAAPRVAPNWIWRGDGGQKDAYFGVAISANGDFNGDGFADLASGASYYDDGEEDEGAVFIYHGTANGLASTPIRTLTVNQANAYFGLAISVGNVNNDAYDDLIVGSIGAVYIYHGSSVGLPASPSHTLTGVANFGATLSATGDINGDNYDDLVIGASLHDDTLSDEGAVFLHLGSASGIAASASWSLAGGQAAMYFGSSLAIVGDCNGDGRDELLVGAPGYDGAVSDEGGAFLYFGTPSGLANSADWALTGGSENMGFGGTVAAAGDTNADGYADILIAAPYHDNGNSDEGAAFLYLGSATGPDTADWADEGSADEAYFGIAMAGVGDVNDDGFDDIVIGASGLSVGEQDEGVAILYLGSASGLIATPVWYAQLNNPQAAFGAALSSGDFSGDGIPDIVVGGLYADATLRDEGSVLIFAGNAAGPQGATAGFGLGVASAYFGVSVDHADVNGDGYEDLLVGASLYSNGTTGEGAAFLYLGSATGLSAVADWSYEGEQENAYFGVAVVGAGDVNGDGKDDVVIGASGYDGAFTDSGRAMLFLGTDSGLASSPIRNIDGPHASAFLGTAIAAAGDTNGDNKADVLIGLPTHDNAVGTDAGSAFLYIGTASGLSAQPAWTATGPSLGSFFGGTVAGVGDTNGDGRDDVLVGAAVYLNQTTYTARATLYRGSFSGLNASPSWTKNASQTNAFYTFHAAGDTNGDNLADFLLAQPNYDSGGLSDRGRVELYRGASVGISTAVWSAQGNSANALFGGALASGDLNRDGSPDLLVAVQGYDNGHTDEGQVLAYYGNGSSYATSPAWQVEPNQISTGFGFSIDIADFNGDAWPETIVGAYLYDSIATDEGRLFIFPGLAGAPDFASPQRFNAEQQFAYFGTASASGDFNGDGYPDLAIAAPYENEGSVDEGLVRIFLGTAAGFSETESSKIQLDQASSYFGLTLAVGDVDNDGFADLAVGVPYYELGGESDEGLVALYKGSASGLAATPAWTRDGGQSEAYFGISLAMLDANGDDFADLAIGASLYDATGTDNGRVQLFQGGSIGLASTPTWTMDGDQDAAYFGTELAAADVNGDGYDDLLVGASFYDGTLQDEGRAYCFHGSPSGPAAAPSWIQDGGQAEAYFGVTLAAAGDVNGDTYDDVLVGATFYDDGETDEGRATLYFGSADGLANSASWTIGADQANAYLGAALASAGDSNGDGYDDFLIGSTYYDYSATNDGIATLFLGSASGPTAAANWLASGGANNAYFGSAFTSADYDRDGLSDFLVSATGYAYDKVDSGGAFLYYGAPDMDGDGMIDSWEISYGLDPRDPSDGEGDLDNDRLSNVAEHHAGSTPTVLDTDGDGVDDYLEFVHGSEPTDAADAASLFYVAKWGDDSAGAGSLLAPWASIAHALAAVTASETNPITFLVAEGSYCETIVLGEHESLLGAYTDSFAARSALTAITGDVVLPEGGGIDGFAIFGNITMSGSAALTACTVSGGGITSSGDSSIAGCLIVGNTIGVDNSGGTPKLVHNTFAANATDIAGSGQILKNCLFDDPDPNFAYSESGAWTAASSTGRCTTVLTDSTASWAENELFGLLLDHHLILANTASTITVAGELNRAAGASYEIANHRLGSQSYAIDAAVMDEDTPDADRDGNLGYDDQAMANIGSGPLTYIDLGAFERQTDSELIPPSLRPVSFSTQEDLAYIDSLSTVAIGASALSFTALSAPAAGTLTLAGDGAFTYVPANNDFGSYSFTYRATDTAANSASTTATIVVEAVNDPPLAASDSIAVLENSSVIGNVLDNDSDIDGDSLGAVLVGNVSHGSLSLASDGSFSYTPTPEYVGSDSFSYHVSDGVANSAPVSVSITVCSDAAAGALLESFQISIAQGQTVALADPYGGDLAAILAAAAGTGDQLHVWVEDHFNTYEHGSGDWRILGSTSSPDSSRFSASGGFLLTRSAAGSVTVTISGEIPSASSIDIAIPADGTALFTYPYPQAVYPARLAWTGAGDGDELRIWDSASATWDLHTRSGGAWPTLANSAILPIGTPVLYRSSGGARTLTFESLTCVPSFGGR